MGAVVFIEISFDALAYGWPLWYHVGMCTTTTVSSPSPSCCVCGADHVDDRVRPTPEGAMCVMCVEDIRADMCADAHERSMGYEGDDDPYWEQHAEG
jgi:hypothetical protein